MMQEHWQVIRLLLLCESMMHAVCLSMTWNNPPESEVGRYSGLQKQMMLML